MITTIYPKYKFHIFDHHRLFSHDLEPKAFIENAHDSRQLILHEELIGNKKVRTLIISKDMFIETRLLIRRMKFII